MIERSSSWISSASNSESVPTSSFSSVLAVERLQGVGPEGAHADRSEIRVAHHHGVRRAPLEVGDLAGADEVDLGHEGAVEAVLPARQGAEQREVLRLQAVLAGLEDVGHLALPHEDRALAGTHDELGPVLDLVVVAREAPHQRVSAVVDPFDDVDEFRAQLVHDSHGLPLYQVRSLTSVSNSDPTTLPSSGSRFWPIVWRAWMRANSALARRSCCEAGGFESVETAGPRSG